MRVLDRGHRYEIDRYDVGHPCSQQLQFMKREGIQYPGNEGSYPGTNCQEVLRVLIDRTIYLDNQIPAQENQVILAGLRSALLGFELRAARRHGRELPASLVPIEHMAYCRTCGHIGCKETHDVRGV